MWEPRRLTTLLVSIAYYRDSFTFLFMPNNQDQDNLLFLLLIFNIDGIVKLRQPLDQNVIFLSVWLRPSWEPKGLKNSIFRRDWIKLRNPSFRLADLSGGVRVGYLSNAEVLSSDLVVFCRKLSNLWKCFRYVLAKLVKTTTYLYSHFCLTSKSVSEKYLGERPIGIPDDCWDHVGYGGESPSILKMGRHTG
jgi:hypothetical protein